MSLAIHVRPADLFLGIADRRSIKVGEVADLAPEARVVGLHGAQGWGEGGQSLLQACTQQHRPQRNPFSITCIYRVLPRRHRTGASMIHEVWFLMLWVVISVSIDFVL